MRSRSEITWELLVDSVDRERFVRLLKQAEARKDKKQIALWRAALREKDARARRVQDLL